MTANIKRCLGLYDTDRYITTVNNERDWKGKQYFDQFAYEKFRQAGMVEAQAKEENSAQFKTIVQVESMEAQGLVKPERLAILDTGCAGSVAGREWVEDHIRNLCHKDKRTVRRTQGQANFDFGNGSNLKSQERVVMPVYYADKKDLI